MATNAAKRTAIFPRPKKLSLVDNGDEIVVLLTEVAQARNAKLDPDKLDFFAKEIESHLGEKYEIEDVRTASRGLMYRQRLQGETAFPDLGTFCAESEKVARKRRAAEADAKRLEVEEAERKYRQEHPEEFYSMHDVIGNTSLGSAIEGIRSRHKHTRG